MGSSSLPGELKHQVKGFGPNWVWVGFMFLFLFLSRLICVLLTPFLKVEAIAGWMESVAKTLPKRGYEQACGIWNGQDYIPILRQMGITVMTFEIISVSTIPFVTHHLIL